MASSLTQSVWNGRARLGFGWGLFVGCTGDNSPHAHHAVQIVLSETPQRVWTAAKGWQSCRGAVIGPDAQHRLEESRHPVTLLYLEPDSREGRWVMANAPAQQLLPNPLVALALAAAQDHVNPIAAVLDCLFPASQPRPALQGDAVIEALIASLPRSLPDHYGITAMAAQTSLSPSRVQHRFRAHTGLAVRPYLRWRRLLTALDGMTRGLPLTDAALEAGFSDAAHFTRTFRRHFGIAPSVLLQLRKGV